METAWVSTLRTFERLDGFDYVGASHRGSSGTRSVVTRVIDSDVAGQPSIVLKSKQEPEVNMAQILKAMRIATILEVVGVRFCRVKWGDDDSQAAKTVSLGNCLQHSKWDRDANNQPSGTGASLLPWLEKAGDDALWETVPVG